VCDDDDDDDDDDYDDNDDYDNDDDDDQLIKTNKRTSPVLNCSPQPQPCLSSRSRRSDTSGTLVSVGRTQERRRGTKQRRTATSS
jgi:hypothetical protein